MNRLWIAFWLSLALTSFTACRAALDAFTPASDGTPGVGAEVVREAAKSTGNPLIIAGVNAALTLLTGFLAARSGKKAVEDNDAKEWSVDEATTLIAKVPPDVLAAAIRAGGFKVERV
jgi:hypothetical protein